MIKLTDYYKIFESEQTESLNEGLFDGIKRRKLLGKVAAAANDYYDAIVNRQQIEIDQTAFKYTKEWQAFSKFAQAQKETAYKQKLRAANEMISTIDDRIKNLVNSRRDDDEFYTKAMDVVKDAEKRAREEVIRRTNEIINKKDADVMRTEFDDYLDQNRKIFSVPTDDPKKELSEWKKKHPKMVIVPAAYFSDSLSDFSNDFVDRDAIEQDVDAKGKLVYKDLGVAMAMDTPYETDDRFVYGPDGNIYGLPSTNTKSVAYRKYIKK